MAASTSATSSYKVFLMYKTSLSNDYEKLVPIKSYPDIGGTPELLDASTLEDKFKVYAQGQQDNGSMEFLCNYIKSEFSDVSALDDGAEHDFAIWFGGTEQNDGTITPVGDDGKWSFKATLSVMVNGKGVNEVKEYTITLALTSQPTFA